jgi:MFS family permease
MMYIALYAIKAFLPIYALSIGVNILLVGLFFAIQEAIHMVLSPLGGHLGDRRGYGWSISAGMAVLGLGLPLLSIPGSGWGLIGVSVLLGTVQALITPSTVALVSTQVDPQHLGAGMGLIGTMQNGGKVLGPILGGVLIQWGGYTLTFQLLGVVLLVGAAVVWSWSQISSGKSSWLPSKRGA